jgi:hypothetical protein
LNVILWAFPFLVVVIADQELSLIFLTPSVDEKP